MGDTPFLFWYQRIGQGKDAGQALANILQASHVCLYDVVKGDQGHAHVPGVLCYELFDRYSDPIVGAQCLYGDLAGAVVALNDKVKTVDDVSARVDDVSARVDALEKTTGKSALLDRIEACEANLRALRATIVAVDDAHPAKTPGTSA
uniref:Uncharacterized protein n=1 Tax=Marseillevirus LCMAC103 TaxID=2506604 RepID=A0A481YV33_9VIRU|nr:MAG: hypothetical protein LCMAC103_00920 [Marseillevirus LCMAC103]